MDDFDRWCFTATDPKSPTQSGYHRAPVITVLLFKVCGNDHEKFEEATRLLRIAFEAGREVGLKDKETASGE